MRASVEAASCDHRSVIATRRKRIRPASLACLLTLTLSGCGLSAELDREQNPAREPTPTATRTRAVQPSAPAVSETSPAVPGGPKASPAVPVQQDRGCPPSGLRVGTGPVDAAMGLRAMTITLTNCGKKPYELKGYPAVRVLGAEGDPIPGVRTVEGTDQVAMAPEDPGPEALTLGPGESARAGLYWRMAAEDGTYLRVAPAAGRSTTTVRLPDPLDIGPENILGTTAWAPAT